MLDTMLGYRYCHGLQAGETGILHAQLMLSLATSLPSSHTSVNTASNCQASSSKLLLNLDSILLQARPHVLFSGQQGCLVQQKQLFSKPAARSDMLRRSSAISFQKQSVEICQRPQNAYFLCTRSFGLHATTFRSTDCKLCGGICSGLLLLRLWCSCQLLTASPL